MNVSTRKTLYIIKMVDELAQKTGITLFNLNNIKDETLQPLIEKVEAFLQYLEAVENSVTASLDPKAQPCDHPHTTHDSKDLESTAPKGESVKKSAIFYSVLRHQSGVSSPTFGIDVMPIIDTPFGETVRIDIYFDDDISISLDRALETVRLLFPFVERIGELVAIIENSDKPFVSFRAIPSHTDSHDSF